MTTEASPRFMLGAIERLCAGTCDEPFSTTAAASTWSDFSIPHGRLFPGRSGPIEEHRLSGPADLTGHGRLLWLR